MFTEETDYYPEVGKGSGNNNNEENYDDTGNIENKNYRGNKQGNIERESSRTNDKGTTVFFVCEDLNFCID